MATIGLIAAMSQESDALLRYIKIWKRIRLGGFDIKTFDLYEHKCVLATSGMGIRRASEAARELIRSYTPQLIISFGIAGAVEADLEIGDVVIPEAYCKLVNGVPGPLLPLNQWPDNAIKAAAFTMSQRGAHLITGTAITTEGSSVLEEQFREMKHPILEMETAGIAQAAAEQGIPLLCIRAISDGPHAPLPVDLTEIMDEDANLRLGGMLKAVFRHPGMILRASGMLKNSQIAADNAALAVIEALGSQEL